MNNKQVTNRLITTLLFLLLGSATQLFSQPVVTSSVVGSGQSEASNDGTTMRGTFGQTIIGNVDNGSMSADQGFWYMGGSQEPSSVEAESRNLAEDAGFGLRVVPNPINGNGVVRFTLPRPGYATLRIYDVLGRVVLEMIHQERLTGEVDLVPNLSQIENGAYTIELLFDNERATSRMIVLR